MRHGVKPKERWGVRPQRLSVVGAEVNSYGRYRYLLVRYSDDSPSDDLDSNEVEWAAYYGVDELRAKAQTGEVTFVDGLFEDIEQALPSYAKPS